MDTLIQKIMDFAQELVNADRASLFLVDSNSSDLLYARIFDMGGAKTEGFKHEIRFPIGTGIAGHVAQTGNVSLFIYIIHFQHFRGLVWSIGTVHYRIP